MYVLYDSNGCFQCFSVKLVQPGAHPELYKRKAVEQQIIYILPHICLQCQLSLQLLLQLIPSKTLL